MFVLTEKTFFELFTPIKFIISLLIMLFLPLFQLLLDPSSRNVDFGSISIELASSLIKIFLVYPLFSWTFGIIFTGIIGVHGAPLIAEEVNAGTILILISKPINRYQIFLAKYIALLLYGILLSFSCLFLIGWIAVLRYSGNIFHFIGIFPFLLTIFLYTIVLSLIFISITLALSSIFKKSRNATIAILFIAILSFFGFSYIKLILGANYEEFQIYHFDLGYHLGNIFVYFIELLNTIPPSVAWQSSFNLYGIYQYGTYIDPDQNINLGGLEKTNYYFPIFSLLIWIIIAILLLLLGLISINKRQIYD